MTSNDPWTLHQRDTLRRRVMSVLAYFKYYEREVFLTGGLSTYYDRLAQTPHGALGRLTWFVLDKADPAEFLAWVNETTSLLDKTGSKSERGWPPYMKGLLLLRLKDDAAAVASLEEAVRIYPNHKNPAALALLQYHSALSANMSETVTPWKFSVEGEADWRAMSALEQALGGSAIEVVAK